jgi:hypothetical protein
MRGLVLCVFLVALAATSGRSHAQPAPEVPAPAETIEVTGRVFDVTTGRPARRVDISVEGVEGSVRAGKDGSFTIAAPLGATLVFVSDGFDTLLVTVEGPDLGDVPLVPAGSGDTVIEVSGDAPPAAPGAASMDRDEISHIPGTGNDVLAALDAMPGVTDNAFGGPTSFNGVVIRGSAPEDSKILIDGFEVPFLYHAVGFRSILPAEAIAGLDYLPGGFDVAHGRASSGIVAVTTRGGAPRHGGHAELGVIDGGLLAQGPISPDATYLLAFRRSTIDLVLPSLIPEDADLDLATVPRYYDLQGRVDVDLRRWKLAFSAIGSDDVLELFADDERDPDLRFFSRARFLRLTADARWSRGRWSARVAVSPSIQNLVFEFGRDQFFEMVALGGAARGELTHTAPSAAGLGNVVTRVGAEANIGRAQIELALPPAPNEGEPMAGPPGDEDISERFDGVIWVPDVAAWTATSFDLDPRIRMTAGLRVDGFARSGDVAVQPRGELQVKLPKKLVGRLAAGAYRRPAEYQDEFLDDSLHPERATQVVLGVEHGPTAGVKVQASLYYTDRTQLLSRLEGGDYENVGRGTTIGGELLVILRRGQWFGWMSYALSRSTRIDRPGMRERLFDFDTPHDLNLALSWKSKNKKWQLGGRFTYTSGQPYTPVIGSIYDSDADSYIPLFADVNSARVPGHHQFDVRIDRTFTLGRVKLSAFLDVQNVYLNATVAGYGYNFDYSERFEFETIPILPSIGLKGEL